MTPLLATLIDAALAAGAEIAAIYGAGCAIETKDDGSLVTEADRRAEAIVLVALAAAYPAIPVIAEEEACAGRIPAVADRFFLVDPLDGTRGFAARNGEFTVNIALVEQGVAVAGVIYAPDSHLLYFGAAGEGAWRRRGAGPDEAIRCRAAPASGLVALTSRSGVEIERARLADLDVAELRPSSSSLKFCMIAEGAADIYPRHGPTMEWDTAAGQAILEAAGGRVAALDDAGGDAGPLRYGRRAPDFRNPWFIASGGT